jgi:proteasome lid subunit RPN8/RPN11
MKKLTLKEFRCLTEGLPEETVLTYHAHDEGACLASYTKADLWLFPKNQPTKTHIVLNPASDYDPRSARKIEN